MQKVNDYTLDLKKKQVRRPWERKKNLGGLRVGMWLQGFFFFFFFSCRCLHCLIPVASFTRGGRTACVRAI